MYSLLYILSGKDYILMMSTQRKILQVVGFLLLAISFGMGLAWLSIKTDYAWGWLGALVLIGWAVFARRRWHVLYERNGSEPGAPERVVWQRLTGYATLFGHMLYSYINPHIDLHVGSGNYLAVDNWTLILGVVVSAMLFRADRQERDERSDRMFAIAILWGYRFLIGLLAIFSIFIGFLPSNLYAAFNHFVIGNMMIGIIVLSLVVVQAVQLFLYAGDRLDPS
jgi:hypothetical protein